MNRRSRMKTKRIFISYLLAIGTIMMVTAQVGCDPKKPEVEEKPEEK